MNIAWGPLLIVGLTSLAVGVAVMVLVSFALVGLSARHRGPVPVPDDGRPPSAAVRAGTAVAVLCLLVAAAIVVLGLYLIVS